MSKQVKSAEWAVQLPGKNWLEIDRTLDIVAEPDASHVLTDDFDRANAMNGMAHATTPTEAARSAPTC